MRIRVAQCAAPTVCSRLVYGPQGAEKRAAAQGRPYASSAIPSRSKTTL